MFPRKWLPAALALALFLPVGSANLAAQQNPVPSGGNQTAPAAREPEVTDIPLPPQPGIPATTAAAEPKPQVPEIRFPNFDSCPIGEIRRLIPGLAHLKAKRDQSQLAALLDKIGAQTVEAARRTPNLLSHEVVVTEENGASTRENYSFLILQHPMGREGRVFDEYRVDVATGEKLQTDFMLKATEATSASPQPSLADLAPALPALPTSTPAGLTSQGFVSAWLYFYPTNRKEIEFRYLGQKQVDGQTRLVVAFVQRPESVRLPAVVAFNGNTYKIFMQGVAWIDPTKFRIVRLRTELLSVPAGVPLRRMSADVQFAEMSIAELPSPVWLPTEVVVTTDMAGSIMRENHVYSKYRLFRTRSRIVTK
ncbi:MAG TPA: hypothetical protein VMG31_00460 [Verrucomicrobiae bacterium]|nr:hypothetical protein [Verrucomicrobiae bacterium]